MTRRDESGAAVILVSVSLVALIAMAATVVDLGYAREQTSQAQVTADAAALAGAQDFSTLAFPAGWPTVVGDVATYTTENMAVPAAAWTGCSDPGALAYHPDAANDDTCISSDSSTEPTSLRVRIPTVNVPANLATALGYRSFPVSAAAQALVAVGGPCALCLLSPTGTTLTIGGSSATVKVSSTGAGVVVDSSAAKAVWMYGSSDAVTAPAIGVVGPVAAATSLTGSGDTWSPAPTTGIAPVADPLAGVAVPTAAGQDLETCAPYNLLGAITLGGSSQSCTLGPGVYASLTLSGSSDSVTLQPGTYVFTGAGVRLSGSSAAITGTGVTLYFACLLQLPCIPPVGGAALTLSASSATFAITPPTSGPDQGLSVMYDRNNVSPLTLSGSSVGTFTTGTIYARSANLTLSGSSSGTTSLHAMVVVASATLPASSAGIDISYNPAENVRVTGLAALSR